VSDVLERMEMLALRLDTIAGVVPEKRGVYVFQCPTCRNRARNDQRMEPMCTGPGSFDEHEPTIMRRVQP
jgi:hypothetical protein